MNVAQALVRHWTAQGIDCPVGVDATDIAQFESKYNVYLPADLRHYFLTVNGMGPEGTVDDDFYSFWQLDKVLTIAESFPDLANNLPKARHYFLIADHSVYLPAFAILLSIDHSQGNPVARVFPDVEIEDAFASFTEFAEYYLRDPLGATA
jgi:hypothetical protein